MKLRSLALLSLAAPPFVFACSSSGGAPAANITDENGDRIADDLGVAVDANMDGQLDWIDIDGDGSLDGLGVDTDGDGFVDALALDEDGDGFYEAIDVDGDKKPDRVSNSGGNGGSGGGLGLGTGGSVTTGGATSAAGGSLGGGTVNVGIWNAFTANAAEATLATEYATWKAAFLTSCGDGLYAVETKGGAAGAVVSEGIGYGMLITATLGEQAEFAGLARFYADSAKADSGLMRWTCSSACSPASCTGASATDGDLDVAMALLQAEARWAGMGYREQALEVIRNLRGELVTDVCGSFTVVRPGEWGGCSDDGSSLVNPSSFAPGYYRVFAALDTEGADVWNAMLEDAYVLLDASKGGHPDSLTPWPDALSWNGSSFVNDKGFSYNGYDACRVPWRIATDYAWSGDARAKALLEWTAAEVDAWNWTAGNQNGMATDANSAFFGSVALAGGAVSQEKADAYYASWMSAQKDDGPYYQATLRLS